MPRKPKRILPANINFDDSLLLETPLFSKIDGRVIGYVPYELAIDSISKIVRFKWQINGVKFEINPESQIFSWAFSIENINLFGRIKFHRLMSSEYPHKSESDQYTREISGQKIWLLEFEPDVWENKEFWDEKEIEIS